MAWELKAVEKQRMLLIEQYASGEYTVTELSERLGMTFCLSILRPLNESSGRNLEVITEEALLKLACIDLKYSLEEI